MSFSDAWETLLQELDLPDEAKSRLNSPEDVLRESTIKQLENAGLHGAALRAKLMKELGDHLREEASSVRSTAARLQKTAESLRADAKDISDFVGTNLSSIRSSQGETQRKFVEEDLEGALARSTYADLERGETTSMRSGTIEEMAEALDTDPRLLLVDKASLRAMHMLLARLGKWRGKTSRSRSIREALREALQSKARDELETIVNRSGPDVSTEILECLFRLPPLDDPEYDTPGGRYGALLGWKWGGDIPEEEEDLVAHYVGHIESYEFTDFPELGRRIIGAVILGFWGYYLTRATRLYRSADESMPLDPEIWRDYSDWLNSHLPEGLPEDLKP